MPLELSELTLEEALRSYSSIKGHRTRVEKEIGNLLCLLSATYSVTSEDRLNDKLVEKQQTYTDRLSDIAEYLVSLKYAKARDHQEEVADFKEILDKCSEEVFKLLHERHAAAPRDAAPALAAPVARPSSKPSSSELKPEKLTHDASTSTFRTWKKQFRAYFDSAQLGGLPCTQQQAYLCNCLDSVLRARIDREALLRCTLPLQDYSRAWLYWTRHSWSGAIPDSCAPEAFLRCSSKRRPICNRVQREASIPARGSRRGKYHV